VNHDFPSTKDDMLAAEKSQRLPTKKPNRIRNPPDKCRPLELDTQVYPALRFRFLGINISKRNIRRAGLSLGRPRRGTARDCASICKAARRTCPNHRASLQKNGFPPYLLGVSARCSQGIGIARYLFLLVPAQGGVLVRKANRCRTSFKLLASKPPMARDYNTAGDRFTVARYLCTRAIDFLSAATFQSFPAGGRSIRP